MRLFEIRGNLQKLSGLPRLTCHWHMSGQLTTYQVPLVCLQCSVRYVVQSVVDYITGCSLDIVRIRASRFCRELHYEVDGRESKLHSPIVHRCLWSTPRLDNPRDLIMRWSFLPGTPGKKFCLRFPLSDCEQQSLSSSYGLLAFLVVIATSSTLSNGSFTIGPTQ